MIGTLEGNTGKGSYEFGSSDLLHVGVFLQPSRLKARPSPLLGKVSLSLSPFVREGTAPLAIYWRVRSASRPCDSVLEAHGDDNLVFCGPGTGLKISS